MRFVRLPWRLLVHLWRWADLDEADLHYYPGVALLALGLGLVHAPLALIGLGCGLIYPALGRRA